MRKFIAMLAIVGFLVGYIALAATIGSMLVDAPRWVQLIYFVIAGILWAFPLKPIMDWSGRGGKASH